MGVSRSLSPWVMVVLWIAAIGAMGRALFIYAGTAGPQGEAPMEWPASSAMPSANDRPQLVIFLHPQCPCSRATVANLDRLLARLNGRAEVDAMLVAPPGVDASWVHGSLETGLRAMPGVRVHIDANGREARLFGAHTSGQVYLYDFTGHRVFSGGITPARGHEGDNPGFRAILSHVSGQRAEVSQWPVLGCPLFDEAFSGESTAAKSEENS